MLMIEYRSVSWWYWLVTVGFLTAGVLGYSQGFLLAIGLTLIQLIHFIAREGSATAFPVQVRLGYLLLLLVALPAPLQWIYWIPTIGTWAQVLFGYCTMARTVSLLPWNRKERFSVDLVKRVFLSAPVRGNVLQGLPPLKPSRHSGAEDRLQPR
jgi:hypothetical protein